jgi:hypothetical protein
LQCSDASIYQAINHSSILSQILRRNRHHPQHLWINLVAENRPFPLWVKFWSRQVWTKISSQLERASQN